MDVSPICLGCMSFGTAENWVHNPWALNEEDSRTVIKRALDLGINFFDMLIISIQNIAVKWIGGDC
jgi:aryl-alcohol dehydrogenase-like predicted oxidoreductase